MNIAPIALFVYNRPWHTRQTIEALQKNELASSSKLFIFSDGPKKEDDLEKVLEVRDYIKSVQGFQDVQVIERGANWGLADSIIDGVTQIINQYSRIIVIEDDLVTSPHFLTFMNNALEFYRDETKVWHISGWNYPIDSEGLPDTFLWRVMNCWGWATWSDRWQFYRRAPEEICEKFPKDKIRQFNLYGAHDFWSQVMTNVNGRNKTWAIFWYATIFLNAGLCLNPTKSLVQNIGLDGSGTNSGKPAFFQTTLSGHNPNIVFQKLNEEELAVNRIMKYFDLQKSSFLRRCLRKIKRMLA